MPVSSGTSARILAYNTVVHWLAPKLNLRPTQISVDRTFSGPPPGGYGQVRGAFLTMCDDISLLLSQTTGRTVSLPGVWRIKHQNDVIADFINAVAIVLMSSGTSPAGRNAVQWAMN